MYTIGEFSRINRITTKTLRHYDRIGLFKPAAVDEWTGYRYYKVGQLSKIARILALRDLGFSLEEIGKVLQDEERNTDRLREHIEALEQEKHKLDHKIGLAREYLERLEQGQSDMAQVEIKAMPEVMAACMRTRIPSYDTFFDIVPKMGQYMESVGAVCSEPAYCFTIYHDGEYRESDIDAEVCEAVVEPCKDSERVRFKTVPGYAQAACLMHKGPYSTLSRSYNALFGWISENGYTAIDHPRESYIDGIWNRSNPEDWLTEVQIPIAKS